MRKWAIAATFAAAVIGLVWTASGSLNWPDRRPIGALFLASNFHVSAANPRGWFNDRELDISGPSGREKFRKSLFAYADRSIAILKATGAQGMIAWDLEGEQFPHKTTYIGDPRLLPRLAPEMDAAADEFFRRFRSAGFRVGLTIRPQQLVFDPEVKQEPAADPARLLLAKIDYARQRWGATLFYIDSNAGIRSPVEWFMLRQIAAKRPDILLIPEHHDVLYYGFSAPYGSLEHGDSASYSLVRLIYRRSFKVVNVSNFHDAAGAVTEISGKGDVAMFPAWYCGPECKALESFRFTTWRQALPGK